MSKHWYAQTQAWASIAKAKRKKRAARRASHGAYRPRGSTSDLRLAVEAATAQCTAAESAEWARVLGRRSREPDKGGSE